ncbi:MAG: aminotransferase class V-fold PLP-dependent enzyme [Clostridiales bacterium]|nr:aminotransferase class V-fold PLP-dependent enzyme [Clostridiales bacterium]
MSPETYKSYGVSNEAASLALKADEAVADTYKKIDEIKEYNQLKVLNAFRECRFSDTHMGQTTGYGYDDMGREKIEEIFAKVFGAQKAYVRMQISSGTQAISSMLYGICRPGDTLLSVTGRPYDTLASTIGLSEESFDGSLIQYGTKYEEVELKEDGSPDLELIRSKITDDTKVVFIQKSRGYTGRRALLSGDIRAVCDLVHGIRKDIIVAVDNCYGEFTEKYEPCDVGADICAGSLIKNPGGGICPTGGYVTGREDLVEKVAQRITAPGLGSHVGPTLGFNRTIAQGLFMAPHVVSECLKGAVFASRMFEMAGVKTSPSSDSVRGDIVQTVIFEDEAKLVNFCGKIQACSPVDSFVTPEPWDMPGYEDKVVMAAGAFTQGATTELSCDGPIKPPYIAYMQGGLVSEQCRLAVMLALS